jgi:ParB-like chromosome segregation protein Spo0J
MTTMDELQAADRHHAEAIAELRARLNGHDEDIARHEFMIGKLNETMAVMREAVAKVATKDDVMSLSRNIDEKFNKQLSDAHNSIPGKIGLWLTGGSLVMMGIGLLMTLVHHG